MNTFAINNFRFSSWLDPLSNDILDRIYSELGPRDTLTLSATCRALHTTWRALAWRELIFLVDENSQEKTINALVGISGALGTHPKLGHQIEAVSIRQTGSALQGTFTTFADERFAKILRLTPKLQLFHWWCTDFVHPQLRPRHLEYTVNTLRTYCPQLRDLRIQGFDSLSPLHRDPPQLQRLERAFIRCRGSSDYWVGALLDNASSLQCLDYMAQEESTYPVLRQCAQTWTRLTTLVLTCLPSLVALQNFAGLIRERLFTETLTSFSLNCSISQEDLLQVVDLLAGPQCHLRRFRLVACAFNAFFMERFGPALVLEILRRLPHLEELILDQHHTSVYTPLPGEMEKWARCIREAPSLRILTLPILFIADDVTHRLFHPDQLHPTLAAWADDFVAKVDRPTFSEIRFLNTDNGEDTHYSSHYTHLFRHVVRHAGVGYRVLRFQQQEERDPDSNVFYVRFLGQQSEGEEAEMMFWVPRLLVE